MGYESQQDYELPTVRGKVKIDVYAVKKSTPIPTVVLCECKFWNKAVDQNVIYGFRSICNDVGAHFGLIVSRAGFQSGARETREATNVHLLDFHEFQETFFDEWSSGMVMKFSQMYDSLIPLISSMDPRPGRVVDSQPSLAFSDIFTKYEIFYGENRYSKFLIGGAQFPISIIDPRGDPCEKVQIPINTIRQYVDIGVQGYHDACKYFGI